MSDPNAQQIAGWYPDPENEAGDRWWNGATWSDHRRARNAAPGWAPAAGVAPAPARGSVPPAPTTAAGGPVMPPYAPPYAYNYAPRTPMLNTMAFAGMLTSLIALLFNWILFGLPGIAGGAISIAGLLKANKLAASGVTQGTGRGYALVGIISGFAGALLWDLFYFAVFQPISFS